MADVSMEITDKAINQLPLAKEGQYKVLDTELKGFVVVIGRRKKTFAAQSAFWRDGVREFAARKKIAEFGDITSREARAKAKDILAAIAKGQRPGEDAPIPKGAVTLRQAWERYRDVHMVRKGRSEGTIENYRDHMERLFEDWLDKPLARLGRQPTLVAERHDKVTQENGPYIANGAMRSLRAVYNHARKAHTDLPFANPTLAVDWNPEARRNTGMGAPDLLSWFEELHAFENLIRREFHLLLLLSGSRPTALKHAKLEHLDFRARILHIPRPKGGKERAFDIPLSRAMIRCIVRAIRVGRMLYPAQADIWIFPADSGSGHIEEHKEDRTELSKWGNDLRQSYRTIAQSANISKLDIHLLMNHSVPGVNEGYITRDKLLNNHLRQLQERISSTVLGHASKIHGEQPYQWLETAKIQTPIARIDTRSLLRIAA